ncbi:hypothetical protein Tco_1150397 [Tanacetum coccineum]
MLKPLSDEPLQGQDAGMLDFNDVDIRLPLLVYVSREKCQGPRRSGRLEGKSRSKAKIMDWKAKSRPRRSKPRGTNSDLSCEGDSEDTCEDWSTTYKRPKPTPFTSRITRFRHHVRAKQPQNVKLYEGSKDPDDHLGILSIVTQ